jgi:hypothetical protein
VTGAPEAAGQQGGRSEELRGPDAVMFANSHVNLGSRAHAQTAFGKRVGFTYTAFLPCHRLVTS